MKKNLVIFSLIVSVIIMAIGYIKFSNVLGLENLKKGGSRWDIGIKDAKLVSKSGSTTQVFMDYTAQTLSFHVYFDTVGDYAKYKVKIANYGNIDARIESIIFVNKFDDDIVTFDIENLEVGKLIEAGREYEFFVNVKYNREAQVLPFERNQTIIVDFIQKK